jgi:hypothetical protein
MLPTIEWTPELIMKEDYLRLTGERYRSFHEYVEYKDGKWNTEGIHFSGYNLLTKQVIIFLWLDQNKSIEEQYNKLMLFYPYIKYNKIPLKQPYKLVMVTDSTLSEFGTYELHIYYEDQIELVKYVYHTKNLITTFKGIREAFEYVYKNLPYQKSSTTFSLENDSN